MGTEFDNTVVAGWDGDQGLRVIVVIDERAISYPVSTATPEVSIGRFTGSSLVIDHHSLSRFHAILRPGLPVTIEDLGSANGTYVREVKIQPGQRVPVTVGDVVRLGAVILILRDSTTTLTTTP